MAITTCTVFSVDTLATVGESAGMRTQIVEVLLTIPAGTYDNTAHATVALVPKAIQDSRRNGRTVTMRRVLGGYSAPQSSTPGNILSTSGETISSTSINFNITNNDLSTELGNVTIPTLIYPLRLYVLIDEADINSSTVGA